MDCMTSVIQGLVDVGGGEECGLLKLWEIYFLVKAKGPVLK